MKGYSGRYNGRQWIFGEKGPERRRSGPFPAWIPASPRGGSEVEADRADDLVAVDAGLIVRIAIFGPEIGMLAKPELDARADAGAVEIAVIGEIHRGGGRPVVVGNPRPRIGIAGLGVDQGPIADQGADPAADVEVPPQPRAGAVAGDDEAAFAAVGRAVR